MNIHELSQAELTEVFRDAGDEYVRSGDRLGYINRMKQLGIINSEILANLEELDIRRAELFNQALAAAQQGGSKHVYRSARHATT